MIQSSLASKSPSRYGTGPLWKKRQKDYLFEATRQKEHDDEVQRKLDSNTRNFLHDTVTHKNEDRDYKSPCVTTTNEKKDRVSIVDEIPISFWSQQALVHRKEIQNPRHLFAKNCSFTQN